MSTTVSLLITYLKPQRGKAVVLAALVLTGIGLQLGAPRLMQSLIDASRAGTEGDALTVLAAAFLAAVLAKQIVTPITTWISDSVGWSAMNALRADLTLHLLRLDLGFHNSKTPGELIERTDGDISTMANFFSQFVVRVAGNVLLMAGALIVLWLQDARLGAALTVFAAISLVALARLHRIGVPYFKAGRRAVAMTIAFIEERIAGTEDLRGNGGLPFTLGQMRTLTTADGNARRKANTVARVTQGSWELLLAGGLALAFTLGALFITAGTMTLGALYLVFAYTSLISANLMQITEQLDDFQRASANIERTAELLNTKSRIADGPRALPAGPLAVAFESVGFEYAGDTPVLRDVSFRLEAGRKLGLLGRTGSGKTTIARLLSRFYDPVTGRVTLGGMDLREAQVPSVRARVSVVTQEVQLFHGTVRDNLTFWDNAAQGGRIGDEQIRKALASLGLGAWLGRLSNGLDTAIAGSSSLSAGEAQLLALGRAFLQNPGLVILDEASARLDPTTERLIEFAIERLLAGRTAIIIAHRLSTAMKADDILVLERGRVVEHGPRLTLQHDPASRFAAMLRTGLIEEDEA